GGGSKVSLVMPSSCKSAAPVPRQMRSERGPEGVLLREVLIVDLLVLAVVAQRLEGIIDSRDQGLGALLLRREAIGLVGLVLLHHGELAVLGVAEVHRQVLQQGVDLSGLDG